MIIRYSAGGRTALTSTAAERVFLPRAPRCSANAAGYIAILWDDDAPVVLYSISQRGVVDTVAVCNRRRARS